MANIIELKNVSKTYGRSIKTTVLHNVSLSFEEHSFNSIIGASGSGKSTILNIMGTLDKPSEGEVYIKGNRIDTMKKNSLAELRNKTIGFIFQFHYLLPEFTVLENVLMPYRIGKGKLNDKIIKRAEELLYLVGIDKVKNNMATNLSGGQQQRTAIARALLNNPDIVLADEPTGNLDSKSTESVYELLRDINKEYSTTFVIITHDNRIAEKTDRIINITDGKVDGDFTAEAYKKSNFVV
ncbi:ABC transporter ATP-binding protein [Clostridium felsineum]|uniref:ABC transporter ATP-binding protein n=1 Tax=Clostridium felsineum TaxID=36839 RepID=UPI00098CDDD9|nr:ABC transporter ATP-binding protein [Clostridium felsineum]MCR3761624.1 ABC transporter ATP-binding protein [Clostridium felsineum]URZ02469.1 Lipoprotein-releasing system ATP-binding protein LolD [Clostridium felsineum]URZ18259.1 Lipoprotein-releasing system ATP-binding protein LolD [Clostridium felsineum DSM 794]